MKRRFRGTEYMIHVRRTGERSLTADGVALSGDVVPLSDRETVLVEVTV